MIKDYFIRNKLIPEDQLVFAEKQARESNVSLEKAIVMLNLMREGDLCKHLSTASKLPYIPLRGRMLPISVKGVLSHECIKRWKVLPVDFDAHVSLLTLAVSSPEQAERIERMFAFLMESHDLAFTIAPEYEIEEGIKDYIEQKSAQVVAPLVAKQGDGAVAAGLTVEKPAKQKLVFAVPNKPVEAQKAQGSKSDKGSRAQGQPKAEPGGDMLSSLSSAVSMMVTAHLATDLTQLARIRTRVRYCQLTATRLNLSPVQTTKAVMAAWFSALETKRDIIRQFVSPYDIEGMVYSSDSDGKQELETLVFTLVRCYQELESEAPDDARDVNLVRRGLNLRWPAAVDKPDVLETFLQVLMDEQFLDKLGRNTGTIIMVDQTASVISLVEPALRRAGHEVRVSSAVADVRQMIGDSSPVLVIINAESSAREMLALCKQLKSTEELLSIPLMVIISAKTEVRGAEFLRAGVDDLLTLPVDIETLYFKIEKLTSASTQQVVTKGVSGSLSDMSFSDLIQVLSAGAKNMEVVVRRDGAEGRLFLKRGDVVHAQTGTVTGEQAFYHLMQWREGEFSMRECSEFPETTIESSTMSLLMEGARLADEKVGPDVSPDKQAIV